MYKKLIIPVVALAVLSVSASCLPVAHVAQQIPGLFHQSETTHLSAFSAVSDATTTSLDSKIVLSSESISTPSDVKIDFDKSLVTSKPAPSKPVEPASAAGSDSPPKTSDKTSIGGVQTTTTAESQDTGAQETTGLAPWQISQLNAQKNYMATMLAVPFAANPPAQEKGAEIVKIAKAHLGVPYVWGGTSPVDGWDCSGYVQWVFGQAGIKLPRVSQWVNETKIDPKDAQPGDLVVQDNGTHVGIYIGHGMMYSALNPSVGTLEHSTSIMKADYYRIR